MPTETVQYGEKGNKKTVKMYRPRGMSLPQFIATYFPEYLQSYQKEEEPYTIDVEAVPTQKKIEDKREDARPKSR